MNLIAALDQGTQSTRCVLYDSSLRQIGTLAQHSHTQIYPLPGYVEHDAHEIIECCRRTMKEVADDLTDRNLEFNIKCLGITNQRESVVIWDKNTGQALHNVIVWMDTRTSELAEKFAQMTKEVPLWHKTTGLRPNCYFSAFKLKWILDTYPTLRQKVDNSSALVGTIDSWIIWNLTGGPDGGVHVTDVTNASRTFLMDIHTLQWSHELITLFGIPPSCLPSIKSCSEVLGHINFVCHPKFTNVPISGCAGDQQASCIGHGLFTEWSAKCTFGTGAFFIQNTGINPLFSPHLITTVCMKLGPSNSAIYGLEGPIADVGGAISWLKENLNAIENAKETEDIIERISDTGGVYFVPAFSGLYAPHWRQDARGTIVGLTYHTTKNHVVRALLESIGFRILEILQTLNCVSHEHDSDSGIRPPLPKNTDKLHLNADDESSSSARTKPAKTPLAMSSIETIRVDGGLTQNIPLMQLVADIAAIKIERSNNHELSILGAAIAAGIGCGIWSSTDDFAVKSKVGLIERRWLPANPDDPKRVTNYRRYQEAVKRSMGWAVVGSDSQS